MRIILRRNALADGEATDLLSRIEAKKIEIENLDKVLSRRKGQRHSRGLDVKLLSEKVEKGGYLAADGPKLKAELKRLKTLLSEIEKILENSQSEYDKAKSELASLVEKFDAEYVVVNYAHSPEIQS